RNRARAGKARSGAGRGSDPVFEALHAGVAGAVGAAEEAPVAFGAVADDSAATMLTTWRQRMDRALERVVGAAAAVGKGDLDRLVVLVAANVASGHGHAPVEVELIACPCA